MHHGDVSPDIAAGLLALRKRIEAAKIPPSQLDESINVAIWNIREFGKKRRTQGRDPLHRRDPGPVRPDRPGRAARQPRGLWPGLPDPRAELGPGLFRLDVRFRRQPRARRLPVRSPRRHLQRPGRRDRPAARQAGHGVSRPAIVLAGALHVLLPRRQLRLHRARHPCALGRQPGRPRGRARHAGRLDRHALQGQVRPRTPTSSSWATSTRPRSTTRSSRR